MSDDVGKARAIAIITETIMEVVQEFADIGVPEEAAYAAVAEHVDKTDFEFILGMLTLGASAPLKKNGNMLYPRKKNGK